MGDRAFIEITSQRFPEPVVFYGHWSGTDNLTAVRNVLENTGRIGDPSYLAAQIFYEFAIKLGEYQGELSFGIETGRLTGNEWANVPSVSVDADTGVYTIDGVEHTEFSINAERNG